MHVFATLRLLRGLLEPILAPLRPIWSQKGTPKLVQKYSKKCPKIGQKNDPKNNQKITNFRHQNEVQNGPRWRSPCTGKFIRKLSWKLLVPRSPKMAQDTPKMAQEGPKMLQDGPKTAPRWPKMVLRWSKMATKWPKMASRRPQDGPRWPQVAQDGPKLAQKGSKIGPRWATWAKMAPKWVQQGFRIAFLSYLCFFSFPFLSFSLLFFPFLSNRMGGLPKAIAK